MQTSRRRVAAVENNNRKHKPDYVLLLLCILLLSIGLIVVYAISPGLSKQRNVSENYFVGKQLTAIALGIIAFTITSQIPTQLWRKMEKPLLYIAGAASVAVRLFGERVNGAYRWIQVGGLSFQAAELIKFALLIWLAGFLSNRIREGQIANFEKTLKPLLIALAIIGVVVAKVQSDLGSTGVMVAIMASMVYVAGLPLKRIAMIGGIIAIGTTLLISSTSYRRDRFATFMNPSRDCQTTGYQACQALIAVGSGGVVGLGLGKGVQAYGYLPEAANDSIFAIFAEKFGFIGVTILLGLFLAFFTRLKNIIERAPDSYSRFLVVGVLAWMSTQTLINIGAMIGLLPLKGITLPFISYGGTSLVFITAAIGVVFQISRYTSYSISNIQDAEEKHRENITDGRRFRGAYRPGSRSSS
ncbi:MAG: putative peptidoglycan glycosyltransferase FtsW [Candidatus Saccharibacteria bacterium]|nr:putative peptidoglycan glycosyltransferase FtsW [Candidatus Saccharibacteria bacterium]